MFKKRFWVIALILCIVLTIGYFVVNTGAVSTVLLAIQGAITDGNLVKFSGTNGIGVDTGLSATNVADAVTKKHTQNADTDLDGTFEATFVKKTDTVNVLSDITSAGAGIEDAVTKKHSQNTDTALGTQTQDLNMGTHKIIGVVDPINPQEAATKAYADTKVATEVDPTVDSDAEIKAILVDEVTKTGDFTANRLPEIDNSTGIIKQSDIEHKANGGYDANVNSIGFTEQVLTSGTSITWDLRLSNKATLTSAHNFTITITAPTEALNAQLIITQDGTGSRVMDEIVTQKDEAIETTEVHIDTEIIDLSIDIPTGARIRFKTSAADLPEPLVVDTIYWAIRSSENHIKVATTKANAIAGTAIDLTDTGTGTHTVQQLVKWPSGTLGVLSTAAGAEDILSLTVKTGDKQWYAQLGEDFY